jgi:hypothetical protein
MGTRSTIALEYADGTVEQVYCHWDGYLSNNGKILAEHYSDPFKLRKLIDLGDLSSLRPTIGVQHPFSSFQLETKEERDAHEALVENMCTFYGRDRNEKCPAKKFKDYADYVKNFQHEEYDYILRNIDGKAVWFVSDHDGAFVELTQAIMDEQDQIAQEETA